MVDWGFSNGSIETKERRTFGTAYLGRFPCGLMESLYQLLRACSSAHQIQARVLTENPMDQYLDLHQTHL